LTVRERSSGKKSDEANYFQNMRIFQKIPAFCVRSATFEEKPGKTLQKFI
jgi:hypothetical protein